MAKLSAHGQEIGRIEFLRYSKAYMSDGAILKNSGFGWKLHSKCKPGITPQEVFEKAKKHFNEYNQTHPVYSDFNKEIKAMAGLNKRWKLLSALELMPDDPDGIWSEVCDGYGDNIHADVSEIVQLCNIYKAALNERKVGKE